MLPYVYLIAQTLKTIQWTRLRAWSDLLTLWSAPFPKSVPRTDTKQLFHAGKWQNEIKTRFCLIKCGCVSFFSGADDWQGFPTEQYTK